MVRVVLGAVVSGIVVFCWGAIAHIMLPIGTMGLKSLSNEDEVLGMMGKTISDPGLYVFPGMDMSKTPTEAEEAAWTAKYKKGPTGILVIHPQGDGEPMSVRQLSVELLTDIRSEERRVGKE